MSIEDKALEAVVGGEIDIPGNIYVGRNTERQHIAEFFYRARTQNLLAEGETPLAIFDCIILERNGRRLGGLTLHDYAVITDQHLITWGRGLNKDIIDRFPWADIQLDKFGRRNPLEGVIKFYYLLKPTGNKRKINLRSQTAPAETIAPAQPRGTAIYLDLMPAGEVAVCVEMIYYFTHSNGTAPSADGFNEHFLVDIERSRERTGQVDFWLRPFYIDMGNGMLVEAGSVADRQSVGANPANRMTAQATTAPRSPYRNSTGSGAASSPPIPAARPERPAPSAGAVQPASRGGQPINAPETVTAAPNYAVTGNVPSVGGSGGALNTGNRQTDTIRGVSRNNDTMRGSSGGGNDKPLRETVSLSNNPYSGPSKLEAYEGRVTGRTSTQSRLTAVEPRRNEVARTAAEPPRLRPVAPPPAARPAPDRSESTQRMPPAQPASPPPPGGRAARTIMRQGGAVGSPLPPATYVSPPSLPIQKGSDATENVLYEMADAEAQALGRPLVLPIGLAIPRGLLNAYSVSRLARGLWIDPRNLGRNLTDVSQALGVVGDLTELFTTDQELREISLRRLKIDANTTFSENIVFHYTIWPFIKPVLDILNLPGNSGRGRRATRRVSVRQIEDDILARETPSASASDLPDMGPMAGRDQPSWPAAASVSVATPPATPAVRIATPSATPAATVVTPPAVSPVTNAPTPTVPTPPPPTPTPIEVIEISRAEGVPVETPPTPEDQPLNTSGKGSTDPTAGMNLEDASSSKPDPKSKLGDLGS